MSDQNTGQPVRSEADGNDERLHAKICDGATPAQMATVDTDLNLHVEMHGNQPDNSDIVLRLSELGAPNGDGDYDVTNNTKPASSGIIAHDRGASIDETSQNQRPTAIGGDDNKVALDVALSDSDGNKIDSSNPLAVTFEESPGTEVHDYDTASAVAKDATDDHDYSVANGVTFLLFAVLLSASGKMKGELQIGDGAVSEVFTSKAVRFNSTSNPNCDIDLKKPITVVGTANTTTVKVIRTNLDNQAQDLYSTIIGVSQ